MRLREMRIGQKERSGNWRADYLETRTVGSEEGGWKRAARAVPRQPPILLAVSVRQMWPLRTPSHVSHALPIPQMSGRMRDAFTCSSSQRGNVHYAWDSHLYQTVDRLLSSVAPPPLRRLDKTGHHLSPAGDADRPCQKQVRTHGSKRTPASATYHPPSTVKRPACTKTDRMLLVLLARTVQTWKQALFIVQPETLLRWHRQGFRLFWKYTSRAAAPKPKRAAETVALIKEMARDNRLWGAERIRGELLKLGIHVCKRTIQKYMRHARSPRRGGQKWAVFLQNHAQDMWACDF